MCILPATAMSCQVKQFCQGFPALGTDAADTHSASVIHEEEPHLNFEEQPRRCDDCAFAEQLQTRDDQKSTFLKPELRVIEKKDVELVKAEIVKGKLVSVILWRGENRSEILARKSFSQRHSFYNELAVAQTVSHPNIVQFFGQDDECNLYMELLNSNLSQFIVDRGRDQSGLKLLSQESPVILLQIAEAMEYLHNLRGVIHGDLKPENILVSSSKLTCSNVEYPLVKVADFGSAQPVNGYKCHGMSPFFAAPEVRTWIQKREPGVEHGVDLQTFEHPKKIDVFAFGGVIYQMLTGDTSRKQKKLTSALSASPEEKLGSDCKRSSLLSLIKDCREQQPENRPSFSNISLRLRSL